jgi:predicted DNA-binding transcriptional regulator AlpA
VAPLRGVAGSAHGPGHDEKPPGTACTARAPRVHDAVARRCNTEPEGASEVAAAPHRARTERDEWLTVEEVCTELKISRRTFDRWRALGTGPKSKRIGGSGPVRVRRS